MLEGTPTVTLIGAGETPLPTSAVPVQGKAKVAQPVAISSTANTSQHQTVGSWASFTLTFHQPSDLLEPQTSCPATAAVAIGLSGQSGTVLVPAALVVAGTRRGAPCGSIHVGSFYAGLGLKHG